MLSVVDYTRSFTVAQHSTQSHTCARVAYAESRCLFRATTIWGHLCGNSAI